MKRHFLYIILSSLLCVFVSCREEPDNVQSYAFNDNLVYGAAKNSYAEKFKVLWSALNANYALWDYEEEQYGLDWDAVYDTYLPKFQQLDSAQSVSDVELQWLMEDLLSPLHDGHLQVQMYNHKTKHYLSYSPASTRNEARVKDEGSQNFHADLSYYRADEIIVSKEMSTEAADLLEATRTRVIYSIRDTLAAYAQKGTLTDLDSFIVENLQDLQTELKKSLTLNRYNQLVAQYAFLNLPELKAIDTTFSSNGLTVRYALFQGNIAYLQFNRFHLTTYLNSANRNSTFGSISEQGKQYVDSLVDVWQSWFDTIQVLHQNGQLGGIIIDVRTNGGGYVNDYQYVLGALLPEGGYTACYSRFKRGPGRYDYSPLMPFAMPTYSGDHAVLTTEPIVVLCNASSGSMSEMTSRGVKQLPNGTLIGTRTYGALSALTSIESYSQEYAGTVGVKGTTPVYCYIPSMATFELDEAGNYVQLEGVGITPDIEIELNQSLKKNQGRDTQLERALQFIRTGN